MRGYLNQQVEEKKQVAQMEKKTQEEQLQMWNKENTEYFKKENETNERVKSPPLIK